MAHATRDEELAGMCFRLAAAGTMHSFLMMLVAQLKLIKFMTSLFETPRGTHSCLANTLSTAAGTMYALLKMLAAPLELITFFF